LIQLDVVDDVAVRDVNVEVAVVVDVEKFGAEAERQEAGAEAGLLRDVLEQAVASEKFVTKSSGKPLPSTSPQSTPMPACGLPLRSKPTPAA
jgi:hypothetical protein